jgi:acetylglutamate kinase
MLPKLAACIDALTGGVPRVHIVSGSLPDSLLAEVFTNEGCGTLIVRERSAAAAEREAVTA